MTRVDWAAVVCLVATTAAVLALGIGVGFTMAGDSATVCLMASVAMLAVAVVASLAAGDPR